EVHPHVRDTLAEREATQIAGRSIVLGDEQVVIRQREGQRLLGQLKRSQPIPRREVPELGLETTYRHGAASGDSNFGGRTLESESLVAEAQDGARRQPQSAPLWKRLKGLLRHLGRRGSWGSRGGRCGSND